jgi:hypothetical protein
LGGNDLLLFAGAIGVSMGSLFAISGFTDAGKTDDLSKNQRVKNLAWLVGGAASVLLFNWKLLSPAEVTPAERATLMVTYALAAVIALFVVILIIAASIFNTVRARAAARAIFQGKAGELVLEYIQYGYRYYRARLDKLDQEAGQADDAAQSLAKLGEALATVMATTALDRTQPNAAQRELFIDQVLAAIEDTVKLFGSGVTDLKLRTNYMVKVSAASLAGTEPHFIDRPVEGYEGFLVIRRYRDGAAGAACLPLEPATRAAWVLPGAPASVFGRAACHMNLGKLKFGARVPATVRRQVEGFFKGAAYVSVLSVPLLWDRSVVGVVNVESNHVDVVNKGSDMIGRIGNALAPHCVILGELVHRAEEN